jgi:hypothetical protein
LGAQGAVRLIWGIARQFPSQSFASRSLTG